MRSLHPDFNFKNLLFIFLAGSKFMFLTFLSVTFQLYRFLARRTDAKFNDIVLRRLFMSKTNRPPLSLARLARNMKKDDRKDKIAVVIGTITNDLRIFKVPKMTVSQILYFKNSFS
jgi:ribosomal protein L18E